MRLSSDTNILALSHRYEYLSLIQIIVADILSHLTFHTSNNNMNVNKHHKVDQ